MHQSGFMQETMKTILRFAAIAAAAVMTVIGCEKAPQGENNDPGGKNDQTPEVEYTDNLEFALEVISVEAEQAEVKVSHNGTTDDSWYGFVTTEDNVINAIYDKIDELTDGTEKISGLHNETSTTVTIKDLEPETGYTYIVLGITEEGNLYGNSNTVKFTTTTPVIDGFQINRAWTVKYTGEGEIDGKTHDHTITVTSTDKEPYLITAVAAEDWEKYGIKVLANEEVAYAKEELDYLNDKNGTSYTIEDILFTGNAVNAVTIDSGIWYALAIGVEGGEPSGLYAISEKITLGQGGVTPETPEPDTPMPAGYAAWIGDWTFTDANGLSFDVTIEPKVNGQTYNMFGWDAPEFKDWPVEVTWIAEVGMWAIYPQDLGPVTFDGGTSGELYFMGVQVGENGNATIHPDIPICIGGVDEEGTHVVMGFSDEENGVALTFMAHFVVVDNYPYIWGDPAIYPCFPLVATQTSTRANSLSDKKSYRSVQKLPGIFREFNMLHHIKGNVE